MREISSNLQAVLDNEIINYFMLVELDFTKTIDSVTTGNKYYFTTLPFNFVFNSGNGNNTYFSDGGLLSFDTPRYSSTVDREAYRLTFLDTNNTFQTEFKNNVIGCPVKIYAGLYTNISAITSDLVILAYKGRVDSPSISNDFESKVAIIECTSPMADLDLVNSFISSKDGMDQKSDTDTSFDQIFKDNYTNLKWGKA